MYSNAGPVPGGQNQVLPNYLEVTHDPLKSQQNPNQNMFNNNQGYYNQNPNQNVLNNNPGYYNQNQQNVVYVPQKIIIIENNTTARALTYPVLSPSMAIIILLLNIFFPGIGTMVVGCVSGQNVGGWICIGLLQLLLAWIIIGWIWAIFTGVMILSVSGSRL